MPLNSYKYLSICHLSIKYYSIFLYNRLKLKSIYILLFTGENRLKNKNRKKNQPMGFFCEIVPKEKTQTQCHIDFQKSGQNSNS